MDDPLQKSKQQQIEDELAQDEKQYGEGDPDATEAQNVDEHMEEVHGREIPLDTPLGQIAPKEETPPTEEN